MTKIRSLILISGLLLVSGCTTYKYQGHNFPSLSSPFFPSFSSVTEIADGIKIRLPEASGKTKMVMDMGISKGSQSRFIQSIVNWEWDIAVASNEILNNHIMEISVGTNTPNQQKNVTLQIQGIHEMNGKEKKLKFTFEGNKTTFTDDELHKHKKQFSEYINGLFASLGKNVKTGDVLKYLPNEMSYMKQTSDPSFQDKIPEIVKGMGVYKSKKVMVTEIAFQDGIHKPDFIMELIGKGYNLYDAETFVQLSGDFVAFASAFSPKEGTAYFKIDGRLETYDVQVRNVIDSLSLTN